VLRRSLQAVALVAGSLQLDAEQRNQRRALDRTARRRVTRNRVIALLLAVAALVGITLVSRNPPPPPTVLTARGKGPGHLAAGSPSALPANILIADRGNNRLAVITPKGQLAWSTPTLEPTDVYLSPHRTSIAVTQRGAFVILTLAVDGGALEYVYGKPGHPGATRDRLRDPQGARVLPGGRLLVADEANCRILLLTPPSIRPTNVLGRVGACVHAPPATCSYPDAVFPTPGGRLVVTESSGWVDLLTKQDTLIRALHLHRFSMPLDANEYAPGKLIVTDHSFLGAVEELTTTGTVLWRYGPASGPGALRDPSLAQVLPGGDVLICDSGNDRIIVIDRKTGAIIWQYGHTGVARGAAGYLDSPDSAVLVQRTARHSG
jgi:hypothetical protein